MADLNDDEILRLYLDEKLDGEDMAKVEKRLRQEPGLLERLDQIRTEQIDPAVHSVPDLNGPGTSVVFSKKLDLNTSISIWKWWSVHSVKPMRPTFASVNLVAKIQVPAWQTVPPEPLDG